MKIAKTRLLLCILVISTLMVASALVPAIGQAVPAKDLRVTSVSINPPVPAVDQLCTITVEVRNVGRGAATHFTVAAYVDGNKIGSEEIGRLDPDNSATKEFSYSGFTSVGVHTVMGTTGPLGGETNLMDNALSIMVMTQKAVTNTSLAPRALPFNTTHNNTKATTTSTNYVPTGCNATLTTERDTAFIITYSAVSTMSFDIGNRAYIKCTVGGVNASPGDEIPIADDTHVNLSASFTFYNESVPPGTHEVAMWFRSSGGGNVSLMNQTLAVITLPI